MAAVIGRGFTRSLGERRCHQTPFMAYYIVVISLNSISILGGIMSQLEIHQGQARWNSYGRCDGWLFTNGLFGVLHILGALYIVRKIQEDEDYIDATVTGTYQLHQPQDQQQQQQKQQSDGKTTAGYNKWMAKYQQPEQQKLPHFSENNEPVIVTSSALKSMGPPMSLVRIRHVLMENWLVAIYFLIYLFFLAWHFFLDMYACNQGMRFVQKCTDIFILAAPCSFIFSVITMLMERREA